MSKKNKEKKENEVIQIGNVREKEGGWKNPQAGRVYDIEGIAPTLNTMQGGWRWPIVIVRENEKQY